MKRWWMVVGLVTGAFVASSAEAQLMPPRRAVDLGSPPSSALSSRSAEALIGGHPEDALRLANQAVAADGRNPWAHYDRATALADLGRVDEAVSEFQAAEQRFSQNDPWGRSVALYGRADLLARVGRCNEAAPVFREYAAFVESSDPQAAAMARDHARACHPGSSG